jgi:hypothetical protein
LQAKNFSNLPGTSSRKLKRLQLASSIDNPTSSALTRSALGWRPQEPELLTDMRESGYSA